MCEDRDEYGPKHQRWASECLDLDLDLETKREFYQIVRPHGATGWICHSKKATSSQIRALNTTRSFTHPTVQAVGVGCYEDPRHEGTKALSVDGLAGRERHRTNCAPMIASLRTRTHAGTRDGDSSDLDMKWERERGVTRERTGKTETFRATAGRAGHHSSI